jgi:hypothetical protein
MSALRLPYNKDEDEEEDEEEEEEDEDEDDAETVGRCRGIRHSLLIYIWYLSSLVIRLPDRTPYQG